MLNSSVVSSANGSEIGQYWPADANITAQFDQVCGCPWKLLCVFVCMYVCVFIWIFFG